MYIIQNSKMRFFNGFGEIVYWRAEYPDATQLKMLKTAITICLRNGDIGTKVIKNYGLENQEVVFEWKGE